jgi:superfamily II DNA or RNA helicase
MGEFEKHEVENRMDKPHITGSAIEHYNRICPDVPAIAFCTSIKHAEHVAEEFRAHGIASEALYGAMPDSIRKYRIGALASGGIKVLTSCDIISEGTDIPVVGAAFLLRPTMSTGLFLQQVGRALRTYPGKKNAIILDHVGNCMRHGLPDEEREWSLDAEKVRRKKTDPEPVLKNKQCEKCYAIYPAGGLMCPQCGHVSSVSVNREVKQVAGDLIKIDSSKFSHEQIQKKREVGQCRTLEDLIELAKNRGYKPQWAYHVFNSRRHRKAAA